MMGSAAAPPQMMNPVQPQLAGPQIMGPQKMMNPMVNPVQPPPPPRMAHPAMKGLQRMKAQPPMQLRQNPMQRQQLLQNTMQMRAPAMQHAQTAPIAGRGVPQHPIRNTLFE